MSYPGEASCIWTINNAPGNRISLTFKDFDLRTSENCDLDYLEIRDNSGIGKLHGIYCGKDIDTISSSQPLWVKFNSAADTTGNPKGFQAEYQFLFGNELTGDSGEIASPMYPRPFRKSEQFSWRITVEFNYVIKIEFLDFDIDSYDDYCYSNLKVNVSFLQSKPFILAA